MLCPNSVVAVALVAALALVGSANGERKEKVCFDGHGDSSCGGDALYRQCEYENTCEDIGEGESTHQYCNEDGTVTIDIFRNSSTCQGEASDRFVVPTGICIEIGGHNGYLSCETVEIVTNVCFEGYSTPSCNGTSIYTVCEQQGTCEDIAEGDSTHQTCNANFTQVGIDIYRNTSTCDGDVAFTMVQPTNSCVEIDGQYGILSCATQETIITTTSTAPTTTVGATTSDPNGSSSPLSGGAVAAIVIVVLLVLFAVAFVAFRNLPTNSSANNQATTDDGKHVLTLHDHHDPEETTERTMGTSTSINV
eukprot:m.17746 g.17746  ORF g.17746 m.17746 type:complete len:307 (-) comp7550_c0_seq2:1093-2013(-)